MRLGGSGFAGDPSAAARFFLAAGVKMDGILNVMKAGNGLQGNQGKRWCSGMEGCKREEVMLCSERWKNTERQGGGRSNPTNVT